MTEFTTNTENSMKSTNKGLKQGRMNMENIKSNIDVYVTKDYDIFKKMLGNRDSKTESKIISSIKEVGQIYNPIIVNEKMEIIDGQNRLAALRQLELPVYYIIQEGLDIEACRRLNIGQTNWGVEDYVCSYAAQGNVNYKRLISLMNEFQKQFGIFGIVSMANPYLLTDGGASHNDRIKKGTYTLTREEYEMAITRLTSAVDLGYVDFCKRKKLNGRVYWGCVSYIYQHQEVSAKKVIEALEQYEALIPSCTKISEQLQFFDDAINRGARRATEKIFLSTDFQKRRFIVKE